MSIHQHTISAVALEDTTLIVLSRRSLYQLHHEDIALFACATGVLPENVVDVFEGLPEHAGTGRVRKFPGNGEGELTAGTAMRLRRVCYSDELIRKPQDIAGRLIHITLVVAVIVFVLHFLRGGGGIKLRARSAHKKRI